MTTKRSPGRPPSSDTTTTDIIKIRVTAAQRLALRRVADTSGRGIAGVIREAVNCYVADYGDRLPFRRTR